MFGRERGRAYIPTMQDQVRIPAAQAGLLGACLFFGGFVVLAWVCAWQHWPAWVIPAVAVSVGVLVACWKAWAFIHDSRDLVWAYAPPPPAAPKAPEQRPPIPVNVAGRGTALLNMGSELPTKEEMRERMQARRLLFFLRTIYQTRDLRWAETWSKLELPADCGGGRLSRPTWEEWCRTLEAAGLAWRPHAKAQLQLVKGERMAFEVFAPALKRL